MKRRYQLALLSVFAATAAAQAECPELITARVQHQSGIADAVSEYVDSIARTGVSGVIVVGVHDSIKTIQAFGYADREHCIANAAETIFDIGSIAKTFTAIGAAQLIESHKLDRTDPISRFIPQAPADKSTITMRQLLTHSAGLQAFHDTLGDFEAMSREDALSRILRDSLRFAPGTKEAYSNSGYTLLAMIEERVTGQSWHDYMRHSIFSRAALHAWFWGDPAVPTDRVAYGYVDTRKTGDPAHWPLTWAAVGASGILMSAPELFKFARAIDNGVLISHSTDSAMQTPALRKWSEGWETSATPYGKLVMKGGASDFGFTGQLRRYVDRGVTIVLLLNSRRDEKDYPHIEVGPGLSDVVFGALSRPAPSLQNL